MSEKVVWVGLVGLRPRPGNDTLGGVRGAFVRFLALAAGEGDFIQQMHEALDEFQFDFEEVSEIEPLSDFVERGACDSELADIARKVSEDGYSRFGEFFVFEGDDA
jgi:hypothetical protein